MSILDASPKMKRAMSKFNLLNSKRQPANIKQILSTAKYCSNQTAEIPASLNSWSVHKCDEKRCGTYAIIFECNEIKFKRSQVPFKITCEMDCTFTDFIYLIKCGGCDKEYIGETSNLRARMRVHRQQTLDPRLRNFYVNHHIAHCAFGKPTLCQVAPFFLSTVMTK